MLKRESSIKTAGMLMLFVVVLIMGGCDDIAGNVFDRSFLTTRFCQLVLLRE